MIVVWLDDAEADLDRETDYLLERNPQAALRIARTIRAQVAHLADYPEMGRVGRVGGTRELVIVDTPYIVPYYLKGREIRILAVIHGKRKWPETFNLQ
jgi:plasmid stabilization system protein ParE